MINTRDKINKVVAKYLRLISNVLDGDATIVQQEEIKDALDLLVHLNLELTMFGNKEHKDT